MNVILTSEDSRRKNVRPFNADYIWLGDRESEGHEFVDLNIKPLHRLVVTTEGIVMMDMHGNVVMTPPVKVVDNHNITDEEWKNIVGEADMYKYRPIKYDQFGKVELADC